MNPQNQNLFVQPNFKIFQGDAKAFPLKAVYAGLFSPFDLTNAINIVAQLPLSAGGFTDLDLVSGDVVINGNPILGQFTVNIASEISPLLQPGTLQDVFAVLTISSGTPINVTSGLTEGTDYVITSVGSTTAQQWQALGLPTDVTPLVGVIFTCTSVVAGVGTGIVQTLAPNSPFTVPFEKCFSVFE